MFPEAEQARPPVADRRDKFVLCAAVVTILFGPSLLKAQSVLDVQGFGARCDGSDDGAAITAALNATPDGGTLMVSCQAGIGASGLMLRQRTGVIVQGTNGGGLVALAANPEKILFSIDQCDACAIRDLSINSRSLPMTALNITNSSHLTIENNVISGVAYPALAAVLGTGNHENVYRGNKITLTGYLYSGTQILDGVRGIWLGNPTEALIEWNPVVTENSLIDIGASAIAINGVGATVSSNVVEGTNGAGIKIAPPAGKGGRTVVEGNSLRRNLFHGVQIDDADSPVLIRNNVIADNIISGVYVSGGGFNDAEITDNTITGNGEAGIYLYNANRVLVEENKIDGMKTGHNGVVLEALAQTAIRELRLHANTITAIAGTGIAVRGRGGLISGVTLSDNTFSGNQLYGMFIEEQPAGSVTGLALMSNCFSGNVAGTLLDLRSLGALPAPPNSATCPNPPSSRFHPVRINVGGGAYKGTSRDLWQADDGAIAGTPYQTTAPVSGTSTPELYQSGRWNPTAMDYSIAVPNRAYTVTLKFTEQRFTRAGQRVFDVFANGELVLPQFDILSRGAPNEAVDAAFRVTVTGGRLVLHMVGRVDNPLLCALEIK